MRSFVSMMMLLLAGTASAKTANLSDAQKTSLKARLNGSAQKFIGKLTPFDLQPTKRHVVVDFGADKQGNTFARGRIFGRSKMVPGIRRDIRSSTLFGETILKVNNVAAPKTVLVWDSPIAKGGLRGDWMSWKGAEVFPK